MNLISASEMRLVLWQHKYETASVFIIGLLAFMAIDKAHLAVNGTAIRKIALQAANKT